MDKRGAQSRQKRELRWAMIDDTIYQMGDLEQNSQIKLKGEENTASSTRRVVVVGDAKRAKENFLFLKKEEKWPHFKGTWTSWRKGREIRSPSPKLKTQQSGERWFTFDPLIESLSLEHYLPGTNRRLLYQLFVAMRREAARCVFDQRLGNRPSKEDLLGSNHQPTVGSVEILADYCFLPTRCIFC